MLSRQSNYPADKSERLEARLSQAQKALLQHAADLSGRTLTDFVLSASQEAAKKVTQEHQLITLTAHESKHFAQALVNPSDPNLALKKAAQRYNDFTKKG